MKFLKNLKPKIMKKNVYSKMGGGYFPNHVRQLYA